MAHTVPCMMCGKILTSKEPLLTRNVVCSRDCSIAAQIEATAKAINNDESNDDILDCGCIDRDQEKVGCESCHRISCLDCHEIDSTPVKVADWKCKEGFGCSMEEEQ